MAAYWKLCSKVLGQAVSALKKSSPEVAKKLSKGATSFDEIIIKGASNADDVQRIIMTRDESGKLLQRFDDVVIGGKHRFIEREYETFNCGLTSTGFMKKRADGTWRFASPINGNKYVSGGSGKMFQKTFEDGHLVSTTESYLSTNCWNYLGKQDKVGRISLDTRYNPDGTRTCKALIGRFTKNPADKKVCEFSFARNVDGFIQDGSLQVTKGKLNIQDDYLPLLVTKNQDDAARDMLSIQLKRQKFNNKPQFEVVDGLIDGDAAGRAQVLGTGKDQVVLDKLTAREDFLRTQLAEGKISEEIFKEQIDDLAKKAMDEYLSVAVPKIQVAKNLSGMTKLDMYNTVAHEVDHLRRFSRMVYQDPKAVEHLIKPQFLSWHKKAMKNTQAIKSSTEEVRSEKFGKSFMSMFVNEDGSSKSIETYMEKDYWKALHEVLARKKGKSELGILKSKLYELSSEMPEVPFPEVFY